MTRPLRVIVCGTTFGRVHLAALSRPESPAILAGILARGSDRSRSLAERLRVPLYREVAELPDDVDAACVAVRAGVIGGQGSQLAAALLERGVHVLQEHPVHGDELAGLLRAARRQRLVYRLNNHYLYLPAVRRFVAAAHALRRHSPPRFLDALTGIQVAYALFDVLGQALSSLRPWAFAAPPWPPELRRLSDAPPPLRSIDGVVGGVPLTLRVHNQLDPADPDNHAHLLHRITLGADPGNVTLVNTHGPVLWSPRLHVAHQGAHQPDNPHLRLPSAGVIGEPAGPAFGDVINDAWPRAMAAALADFGRAIANREDPMRLGQYHLTAARVWQDATTCLGQPDLIQGTAPEPIAVEDLVPQEAVHG